MSITINGTTGVTFPAGGTGNTAGAAVGTTDTQTLTNKTLTSPTINTPTMGGSVLTSGTAQASTSGTAIEFTSIPSWVKRITVMFFDVSTNGTNDLQVQLGDSGGYEITGYLSASIGAATTVAINNSTVGFVIYAGSAAIKLHGSMVLTLLDGSTNTWTSTHSFYRSDASSAIRTGSGSKALSGTLTQVRIIGSTTGSPTDTFDAGSINIIYE